MKFLQDGAALRLSTGTWRSISPIPIPDADVGSTFWTGNVMIVHLSSPGSFATRLALYYPASDRWQLAPEPPFNEQFTTAVWTGRELLLWGGLVGNGTSDPDFHPHGAAYDPATNSWRNLPMPPLKHRFDAHVWTGGEMLLFGGSEHLVGPTSTDAQAFDPATGCWRVLPSWPQVVGPRALGAGVWTGREAILAGGPGSQLAVARVPPVPLSFDVARNAWRRLPASPVDGMTDLDAIWTGREAIFWAGPDASTSPTTRGAIYTPS